MSGNVGIFADLILLALLLIGLVLGWRQGFVQALTRIIVVVAALLLASWIAGKLAEPAARWLEPILSEKLEQRLTAQGNTDDAVTALGKLEDLYEQCLSELEDAKAGLDECRENGFQDDLAYGELMVTKLGLTQLTKQFDIATGYALSLIHISEPTRPY